ncbi:MAG: phosphorylase [Candidatus Electrothrix sp. AR4]|nr:phosphorylase [Candidatus Electrothrix sp. AR4]
MHTTMDTTSVKTVQCIINPERLKGEPALPTTGILAVNPSDSASLAEYAKENDLRRHFLFNANLYSSERLFLAGPAVGAPMAVMCLEKLIVLGAKKIILYGWCGSLQKQLHAMDVLVPTEALSEEGTSQHYQTDNGKIPITPSSGLRTHLCDGLSDAGIDFQQGPLWTTDAPYRETRTKVIDYGEKGLFGVDMEYAALCTVATFRGVELAAVMLVSDELWRQPWTPQYSFKQFKKKSKKKLLLLCGLVQKL